ncbi:MAG: PBP1A family penicillin-binding protein [Candidatus Moranbacteria bacterium]|nr:PBP1A family penicillin-binding protein [Candidatus Moranbacteria bacterium]
MKRLFDRFRPSDGRWRRLSEADRREWPKILGRIALWGAGTVFIIAIALFAWVAKDLPSPGKVNSRVIPESTKIYDRSGEHLLYDVHGEEKRTIVAFADIPKSVQVATLVLEDQDFYSHHGIKLSSILRAVFKDVVRGGAAQGGSTITQQFVKNSLLTNEKTLVRKVKEVLLSLEIEQKFGKDEILGMYLNEIPYGSNAYGIEAAAQTFFGKPAKDLSLDESAVLASLPNAPTYYSPYGSHVDRLIVRKDKALQQMAKLGYITQEEADAAIAEKTLDKIATQKDIIAAPHFVMFVKDYLSQKYGESAVESMGLKVYTTLDWDKQEEAQRIVHDQAVENERKWKAENASLVAMDPKTGQVLAMVGSRDYFDRAIDGQVNVAIRERQPGSSFKPYVYLDAFTKGYTPETILYDTETNFSTDEGKDYKPQNYNGKFNGPMPMKETLAQSLNIPAVKTLYLVGVKDAITFAKSLGITSLQDENRYGLSLVLGGGEITLLDHVNAYSTLAQGGVRRDKTAILKIEDAKGNVLEEFKDSAGERVVDEKYVAMLDHIMSTNDYRAPVFGTNNPLRFDNRPVAAKTGTTNEFRDGWTVGFTPQIAVGVWAGNNDNTAMVSGADGINVAAPIFRKFMDFALQNQAIEKFPEYDANRLRDENKDQDWMKKPLLNGELDKQENLKVCEIPGKNNKYCLANEYCPDSKADKKDFVNVHDILFYVDRSDPLGKAPEKPENDPQFKKWEEGVKDWYKKNKGKGDVNADAPTDECKESDFSSYRPDVSVSSDGSGPSVTIQVKADAPYGVDSLKILVDGNEVASTGNNSLETSYAVPSERNGSSIHIQALVKDKNGNTAGGEKSVSVSW